MTKTSWLSWFAVFIALFLANAYFAIDGNLFNAAAAGYLLYCFWDLWQLRPRTYKIAVAKVHTEKK